MKIFYVLESMLGTGNAIEWPWPATFSSSAEMINKNHPHVEETIRRFSCREGLAIPLCHMVADAQLPAYPLWKTMFPSFSVLLAYCELSFDLTTKSFQSKAVVPKWWNCQWNVLSSQGRFITACARSHPWFPVSLTITPPLFWFFRQHGNSRVCRTCCLCTSSWSIWWDAASG